MIRVIRPGFYQTIDSRVSAFKRLNRLSGRLDLILSQVRRPPPSPAPPPPPPRAILPPPLAQDCTSPRARQCPPRALSVIRTRHFARTNQVERRKAAPVEADVDDPTAPLVIYNEGAPCPGPVLEQQHQRTSRVTVALQRGSWPRTPSARGVRSVHPGSLCLGRAEPVALPWCRRRGCGGADHRRK